MASEQPFIFFEGFLIKLAVNNVVFKLLEIFQFSCPKATLACPLSVGAGHSGLGNRIRDSRRPPLRDRGAWDGHALPRPRPRKLRLPEEHSRCSQCPVDPCGPPASAGQGLLRPASGDRLSRPCFCLCSCCPLSPGRTLGVLHPTNSHVSHKAPYPSPFLCGSFLFVVPCVWLLTLYTLGPSAHKHSVGCRVGAN